MDARVNVNIINVRVDDMEITRGKGGKAGDESIAVKAAGRKGVGDT